MEKILSAKKIDVMGIEDFRKLDFNDYEKAKFLASAILSDGNIKVFENGSKELKDVKLVAKDFVTSHDFDRWFPTTIQHILARKIAPPPIITNRLFKPTIVNDAITDVHIYGIGTLTVSEYPEGGSPKIEDIDFNDTAKNIRFKITKKGCIFAITDEAMKRDSWGYFDLLLNEARDAFVRFKEELAIRLLLEGGLEVLDNDATNDTPLGTTTGRGINGEQNGSFGDQDLYEIYAYAQTRGFNIDTIIMHPMSWKVFLSNSALREFVLSENRSGGFSPLGSYSPGWGEVFGEFGLRYVAMGYGPGTEPDRSPVTGQMGIDPWALESLTPLNNTYHFQPKGFPNAITVLTTPLIKYTQNSSLGKPVTDIVFADSNKTGVIANRTGIAVDQWRSEMQEAFFVKLKEEYGMSLIYQGKSIYIAKNVVIDRSYAFENVNSQSLDPLTLTTTVPSGTTY